MGIGPASILSLLAAAVFALSGLSYKMLRELIEKDISSLKTEVDKIKKDLAEDFRFKKEIEIKMIKFENSIANLTEKFDSLRKHEQSNADHQIRLLEQLINDKK